MAAQAAAELAWCHSPQRKFFPVSRVLRDRQPVSFDSDAEDENAAVGILSSDPSNNEGTVGAQRASLPSEIAFMAKDRVETARFEIDVSGVCDVLRAIPNDAWTALLDDDARRKLSVYLPDLDNWNDLSCAEAQRLNVEALLRGDNFHFGNPKSRLEMALRQGLHTPQAIEALAKQHQIEADRFDHNRLVTTRTRLQKLKRGSGGHGEMNRPVEAWKKIRLSSEQEDIHKSLSGGSGGDDVLITEETSLFVAIQSVLAGGRLTAKQVAARLQADYGQLCTSIALDPPLLISFERYIEAALAFLSDDKAASSGNRHWSSAWFATFDRATDGYELCTGNADMTQAAATQCLLRLEQAFRAPASSDLIDTGGNSSAVKGTRRRRNQILARQARDAVVSKSPSPVSFESQRLSSLLKQALVPKSLSANIVDRSQYETQERQRYKQAHDAFVYEDTKTRRQWRVGPAFEEQPKSLDRLSDDLLVPSIPDSVNFVSLVYDACACLLDGVGSRTDIRANLLRSQFMKPDTRNSTIDEAIVAALDFLQTQPPRGATIVCVRYEAESCSWRYLHDHLTPAWLTNKVPEPDCEPAPRPVTPAKMSMKDLLH